MQGRSHRYSRSHHRTRSRSHHRTRSRSQSKSPKSSKRKSKKPLNAFFKSMLKAKKNGDKEFTYKSKTYVRKISKNPRSGVELVVYKEKR